MKILLTFIFCLFSLFAFSQNRLPEPKRAVAPLQPKTSPQTTQVYPQRQPNTINAGGPTSSKRLAPEDSARNANMQYVERARNTAVSAPTTPQTTPPANQLGAGPFVQRVVFSYHYYLDTPNPPVQNWPREALGLNKTNLSGRGAVVAVLDSGVAPHEQFAQGAVSLYDITGQNKLNDELGHGTSVCAIIAASGAGSSGFKGVAPLAKILSYKITRDDGGTSNVLLIKAIEEVIKYNTRHPNNKVNIINISYGIGEQNEPLQKALKQAYDSGITIVAPVGNSGQNDVAYPAAYDFVIGVGSIDNNKQAPSDASFGQGLDFVAPGAELFTPSINNQYIWIRGTSFASAYISGIAALITEAWQNKYGSKPSPQEVYKVMQKISSPLSSVAAQKQGNGLPDASKITASI
ncbi:MAG: S8 family serine peptidase [Elusimicrobiota bacterium]|jgi:subtilisin family serine protease|nr:S8 family serine peptidase [Elusimicrobiota bacterium]